jgi:hypothetical protein
VSFKGCFGRESMTDFAHQVDLWVRTSLATGVKNWPELVASLPGVYPEQVFDSLRRQKLSWLISFAQPNGEATSGSNGPSIAHKLWADRELPTPHPLDACWWFADCSIQKLLECTQVSSSLPSHLILLGIPTIFHFVRKKGMFERVTLVDADSEVRSVGDVGPRYRTVTANLMRDPLPKISGEVVIADPPWYETEVRAFLWTARYFCSNGGVILMSVPPAGTRPDIGEEWEQTLSWSRGLGIELVDYQEGALRYISPPFERNALAAAGIQAVEENWRRGDLAVFSCVGPITHARPIHGAVAKWEECAVEGVRFRVRAPSPTSDLDPTLRPVAAGDIFDSVSRRDPRRDLVDVWTSGNRAFRCSGRAILLHILRSLASNGGVECQMTGERFGQTLEVVRATAARLQEIVRTEVNECSTIRETDDCLDILSG